MLERLIAIADALDLPPAVLLLDDPDLARLLTRLISDTELRAQVEFFLSALDAEPTKD